MGSCCFWLFGSLLLCACGEEPEGATYSWSAMSMLTTSACEMQTEHSACEQGDWCEPVVQACIDYAQAFAFEGDEHEVRDFCIEGCGSMLFECQEHLNQGATLDICSSMNGNCVRVCETGPIIDPLMDPFSSSFYQ